MSETPTPEPLKPDTGEEIAELRRNLDRADTIINLRDQEIATLNARLAGKDEIIAEADEQIERIEFELASRSPAPTSTPIAIELPDAADLLNKLKGKRRKSRADLGDLEAIVEILEDQCEK